MFGMSKPGTLYIVATPIGNLGDISSRALSILSSVNVIAAEDTRHSKRLLQHYAISTPMISLHEHNEQQRIDLLVTRIMQGESVALISDAGTPLISDPGYRLVAAMHEHHISVTPIPGACAAISALVASGLATDRFVFEGFLSAKRAARKKVLERLSFEVRTIILYESTHRIVDLVEDMCDVFTQDRRVTIVRELTKTFETIKRAPMGKLLTWIKSDANQQKGEFVVVIEGAAEEVNDQLAESKRLLKFLLKELSVKQSVSLVTQITGGSKKQIYQLALEITGDENA